MTQSVVAPDAPWFSCYPDGVPHQPELSGRSVHQMLADAANQWPDRVAVNFMGRDLSYPELDLLVSRAAPSWEVRGCRSWWSVRWMSSRFTATPFAASLRGPGTWPHCQMTNR